MQNEKYLPVGTVVMLKGGKKRVMIIGFCTVMEEDKNKIYDYVGCLYPEGVLSSKETMLFNHDSIEKICYMGLSDEEEKDFKTRLKLLMEQRRSK